MVFEIKYSTEWYKVGESKICFQEFKSFDEALSHFNSLDLDSTISSARLIVTHARIKKQ